MTPARSLAASVAALGFASSLTAAPPAFAAPAPCERAENYAAQSGAELLRINRLEIRTTKAAERPTTPGSAEDESQDAEPQAGESGNGQSGNGESEAGPSGGGPSGGGQSGGGATDRIFGADATPLDPTDETGEDSDTLSEGIGMLGEAALDSIVPGGAGAVTDPDAAWKKTMEAADAGRAITRTLAGNPLGTDRETTEAASQAAASQRTASPGPTGTAALAAGSSEASDLRSSAEEAAADRTTADETAAGITAGTSAETTADGAAASTDAGQKPAKKTAAEAQAGKTAAKAAGRAAGDGGKTASVREIGLGESRAAFIATTRIKSAAIARILDGKATGKAAWTEPILQQAPPSHAKPASHTTPAGQTGPLRIGAGEVSAHARWDAGMACARTTGETSRSISRMSGASILGSGDAALVRVPEVESVSTTALDGTGEAAQTVASATVAAGRIELAGGRVLVKVLRAPTLVARMSAGGGEVRYQPARIEVSGPGVATRQLTAAGEQVDVTLAPDRHTAESGMTDLGGLQPGSALRLPGIPGLPKIGSSASEQLPALPQTESAPAAGTKLRIALGGARQVEKGKAIAARATAIKVSVTRGEATKVRTKSGYGGKPSTNVRLDLTFGLMEAAAVAPEKARTPDLSGTGGGLPITGPQVASLAAAGAALLLAGIAAVILGIRRRKPRA